MIVNINDHHTTEQVAYGVGYQLLQSGQYDMTEINLVKYILDAKAKEGFVCAIDGGANIGVHTVEWGKLLYGKGEVISFEPQEAVYYALCGNTALNNCLNVKAINAALGSEVGIIEIPKPDYFKPASFGSLELKQTGDSEYIGQQIADTDTVPIYTIDHFDLAHVSFIKLDIEGMELEALKGAEKTIQKHKPVLFVEAMKVEEGELRDFLTTYGYDIHKFNHNFLAVHKSDMMSPRINSVDGRIEIKGD